MIDRSPHVKNLYLEQYSKDSYAMGKAEREDFPELPEMDEEDEHNPYI